MKIWFALFLLCLPLAQIYAMHVRGAEILGDLSRKYDWTEIGAFYGTGVNNVSLDLFFPAGLGGNFTANTFNNVTFAFDPVGKRSALDDGHFKGIMPGDDHFYLVPYFAPNICYKFNVSWDLYYITAFHISYSSNVATIHNEDGTIWRFYSVMYKDELACGTPGGDMFVVEYRHGHAPVILVWYTASPFFFGFGPTCDRSAYGFKKIDHGVPAIGNFTLPLACTGSGIIITSFEEFCPLGYPEGVDTMCFSYSNVKRKSESLKQKHQTQQV